MNARAYEKSHAAMQYFEAVGRSVVGVEYTKEGFKLMFEKQEQAVNPVDLVDMGE